MTAPPHGHVRLGRRSVLPVVQSGLGAYKGGVFHQTHTPSATSPFRTAVAFAMTMAATLTAGCPEGHDDTTAGEATVGPVTLPSTDTTVTAAATGGESTGETTGPTTADVPTTGGPSTSDGESSGSGSDSDGGAACEDPVSCVGDGSCPGGRVLSCVAGECSCDGYAAQHPDFCGAAGALADVAGVADPYRQIVLDGCAGGEDRCQTCFALANYCAQVGQSCAGLYESCGCLAAALP